MNDTPQPNPSTARLDYEVRPARLSDMPTLLVMWLQSAALHEAHDPEFYRLAPGAELEMRGYWEAVMADPARHAVVADAGGELIGCVQVDLRPARVFATADRGVISNLWVSPNRRRRGVGRALMAAAEQWLRDSGVELVLLNVGAANAEALAFYAALGFRPANLNLVRRL